jgi:hypothetical protein
MRERHKEIRRRRHRRVKLKKLKAILAETKDRNKRDEIIARIKKYEYQFKPD